MEVPIGVELVARDAHERNVAVAEAVGAFVARSPAGRRVRLGSRTSPMAIYQAEHVRSLLQRLTPSLEVEIVGIATSGDRWQGDLAELGGKGAFMKEIDRALVMGAIDAAVHCIKDVPGDVPLTEGTTFAAYLEREDVQDAVVWRAGSPYASLADLPPGTRIGTSSVRRKAQLLRYRPDLYVDRIRGNVNSRLARLDAEQRFEALVLACAGLRRIGMDKRIGQVLPLDIMCPAVGAGVVGVQCRTADQPMVELVRLLDHAATRVHVRAERAMLHALQGHCNSPIAGHCSTTLDGQLSLIGMVFTREGGQFAYAHEWDVMERPEELGGYVAAVLARKGARDIIRGIPH
ncbi:hydroxymethylbilane synthase [Thermocatellispora tengchongensis]|uniref:Porphobilinogen deaminase n=1 Tax=Thermocatellispora tengchongensis TaxID=1073253 RepID=A0A840PIF7_9ACTN|nr:hydroxymethylbilane synthase [Thermocatellispora tengchongensis]MBB5139328.1 hydroxymethylbilane synthase [Thermocatellispora tengchongensis]